MWILGSHRRMSGEGIRAVTPRDTRKRPPQKVKFSRNSQLRLVVYPIVYRVLYINSSTMGQMERDLFRFLLLSCQETPPSAESIESSPQFLRLCDTVGVPFVYVVPEINMPIGGVTSKILCSFTPCINDLI